MSRRILCAPDSLKGSLSAAETAKAMADGIREVLPDAIVDLCPVADGGEGTVEALVTATGGELRTAEVMGPLGDTTVKAVWGILGGGGDEAVAVIEMAAASGLTLVPKNQRNPLLTTTYGTGQLLQRALDSGAQRVLVGLGGSATNDGGCGMAMALGVRFLGEDGRAIEAPFRGGDLSSIASIDTSRMDQRIDVTDLIALCDVDNPLTGAEGAAEVFGPQKGAVRSQVRELDAGLRRLATICRRQLGVDVEVPGAGAAGGLGAGLVAFCGATLRSGIKTVLRTNGFDERLRHCDLCLTGEGQLDGSSLFGKACMGVARAAREHGVPTWAIVGTTGPGIEECLANGLAGYEVLSEDLDEEESIRRAAELVSLAVGRVINRIG